MKIIPLSRYDDPRYPTSDVLNDHPELLRLVPRRWSAYPSVLTALTALSLISYTHHSAVAEKAEAASSTRIAPVFQHGDGRGSFGCDAINPPVFLSEIEARQVIVEEAKRSGIQFVADAQVLTKINVPGGDYRWKDYQNRDKGALPDQFKKKARSLTLDGTDNRLQISYEYVSGTDESDWMTDGFMSSIDSYDTLVTAKLLAQSISMSSAPGRYGVFYDPIVTPRQVTDEEGKTDWQATCKQRPELEAEAKKDAAEQLRKQVQDFIEWLKTEGVI